MKNFNIELAGTVINITSIYSRSAAICRDFIVDCSKEPTVYIHTSKEEINEERCNCIALKGECVKWDGYLETFVLLKRVSEELINYNSFLMHGAVIVVNEEAYVFTAPSGTGKTTHILKWLKNCPDAYVLNGDKPFIKVNEDRILVYSSPWAGKENMYTNTIAPLKAIVFMERATENSIREIEFLEAFPFLLQQIHRPEDKGKMRNTLKLLQSLHKRVKFFRFYCNNYKEDCFEVAYNGMIESLKNP